MEEKALKIAKKYILDHFDKSDVIPEFEVFILFTYNKNENITYVISTTILDGMRYEFTYNNNLKIWYLEIYRMLGSHYVRDN